MSDSSPITLCEIQDARLGYGRTVILDQVNLTLRAGEYWCILGANGAGKSTLLKSLLGLCSIISGKVQFNLGGRPHSLIGYVPQRCHLEPLLPISLREFVSLGSVGAGKEALSCEEVIKMVELEEVVSKRFVELSGGMQQRGMLARALIRSPKLLVLDEPLGGLDPSSREIILRILQRAQSERSCAVLFVTHSPAIAKRFASHLALVEQGAVKQINQAELSVWEMAALGNSV